MPLPSLEDLYKLPDPVFADHFDIKIIANSTAISRIIALTNVSVEWEDVPTAKGEKDKRPGIITLVMHEHHFTQNVLDDLKTFENTPLLFITLYKKDGSDSRTIEFRELERFSTKQKLEGTSTAGLLRTYKFTYADRVDISLIG